MTATTKKRKPTREQAMRTWAQAGAERAQAVVDERRIDEAEYEREHPTYDEDLADRAQRRYEESIGWHCD